MKNPCMSLYMYTLCVERKGRPVRWPTWHDAEKFDAKRVSEMKYHRKDFVLFSQLLRVTALLSHIGGVHNDAT
jgi:hypothetical protein